ncbi:para-aminobenzoate synthase component I [Salmonella enterica subsp. enterica]|uniref:Para-aminobenzoate synthase component I n=1 Tax=Salmonella enterica I TaxID=59201 RepID=A0A3S4KAB1_SALET|nr:para-aminobenzoate synthase component I [Salmonella enterica subsp. enterica]
MLPTCCARLFPGGSITGAPKVRAMEIIDETGAAATQRLVR